MFCNHCGKEIPDGSGFCNFCGGKLNAITDVQSPVSKSSDEIKEKLSSGKDAISRKDWSGAERFFGAVLLEDPAHYVALFYDAYAKAMGTMSSQEVFKRKAEMGALHNVLLDRPNHYEPDDPDNIETITGILSDLRNLIGCSFVFTQTKNGYGMVIASNANETYSIFVETIRNVKKVVDTLSEKADNLQIHRKVLEFYSTASTLSWDYSNKIAISNDLTKWIEEEKQTVETLRRIPIDAYWKEHSEERTALETEKQAALTEIQALQGQIESLDEYTVHKSIENELNEVEGQLSNAGVTGIFKQMGSSVKEKGFKSILGLKDTVSSQMSEKKELKSKKAEVETRLQEAKARLDEAAKNFTDRIAELKQRIDQIEEEFNKDR